MEFTLGRAAVGVGWQWVGNAELRLVRDSVRARGKPSGPRPVSHSCIDILIEQGSLKGSEWTSPTDLWDQAPAKKKQKYHTASYLQQMCIKILVLWVSRLVVYSHANMTQLM